MRICMIGAGYVGLVTGACLAEKGRAVCCVDINSRTIELLRAGESPIYEPGIKELIGRNVSLGRLSFTCDLSEGLTDADVCFIAVGTPSGNRR